MKEILKSKGMISFTLFIIVVCFINTIIVNEERHAQKNVSAENTNNQIITQK